MEKDVATMRRNGTGETVMDAWRQRMIASAEEGFAARGRAGLGLHDLAKRLGLPPRAVFKEFKNRDELGVAVLGRVQEALFAHIESACARATDETGLAMALRLAEAYCRFLEESPEPYLGVVRGDDALLAGLGPKSQEEGRRLQARMVKQFETLLGLGRFDGSVRPDVAENGARRLVTVLVGLVRLRLTRPETRARNLRAMLTTLAGDKRVA
jgi:AcrR family transcriptional regulator